jgi:hypothetical protein
LEFNMKSSIHVAGIRHEILRGLTAGTALYNLVGINPANHHILLELQDDRDIPLRGDEYIVISGHERFSVGEGPCPSSDNPSLRKPLAPVVNEIPLSPERQLHHAKLTFEQLAALDPDFESGDGVFVELRDVPDAQITSGMRVLVQCHDRYYTSPCGNVGFESKLDLDLAALRGRYGVVDYVDEGSRSMIIVRSMPLPGHWSRAATDILLQVPQGYPMSAMDMFWVTPGLTLVDGRMPERGDLMETYLGQSWQRFSWHYPNTYQWNPSVDSLSSHVRFARMRLGQAR